MRLNKFFGNDDTMFFTSLGDAHFATPEEVNQPGLLGEKGIRLGYYRAPGEKDQGWGEVIRYNGDAHLITVAPTGSGKGRDVLVGALLTYEGSCIVIDPKGQLAAITAARRAQMGQTIRILSPLPKELPMDLGPSVCYNPMANLNPESDSFGPDCEAIADAIVMREEGPNAHFSDSARQLITGVMMHLAAHGRPDEKNLVIVQKLISGPYAALNAFIAEALAADKEGYISGKLARFEAVGGEDRELRSIISTAITQCGFINNRAISASLSASDFSFGDLKRQPTTVYLVLPAKYIEPCGKWFRLVLASAIAELWRTEKGKCPVLAILDEFAQLGRLSVIADAMGMARGFGLQLWPILQDLTQLKEYYRDRWETFLGGAAVRQFFAPRENFTAEYVSKLCGVKTVVAQGQSLQHAELLEKDGTSTSWGPHSQPLLHPHNVSGLGPQESIIIGPQNIVIDAFRRSYMETPEFVGLYSDDPYHRKYASAETEAAMPQESAVPVLSFADREAAAAKAAKHALRRPKPLFLRLLTPSTSDNLVWNVARKLEFVLTLPLRGIAALFAVPFALHNKPLAAVVSIVALFGFWEVLESFAKRPLVDVFHMEEHLCKDGEYLATGSFTGHTIACRAQALRATGGFFWQNALLALWKEGPQKAFADFDLAYNREEGLAFVVPLTSSVDQRQKAKSLHMLEGHTLPHPVVKPVRHARLPPPPPPYKLSHQIFAVNQSEGIGFIPITDPELVAKITSGADVSRLSLRNNYQRLPQGTQVRALLNEAGTVVETDIQGDAVGIIVTIPKTGEWGAIPGYEYPTLQPKGNRGPAPQMADRARGVDYSRTVVVSAEGLRYASVSFAQSHPLTKFTFEIAGTLPLNTKLLPHTGYGADGELVPAGTSIREVGPAQLFTNRTNGSQVLIPVADLHGKTKPAPPD